jgi:hypothetical protein
MTIQQETYKVCISDKYRKYMINKDLYKSLYSFVLKFMQNGYNTICKFTKYMKNNK